MNKFAPGGPVYKVGKKVSVHVSVYRSQRDYHLRLVGWMLLAQLVNLEMVEEACQREVVSAEE